MNAREKLAQTIEQLEPNRQFLMLCLLKLGITAHKNPNAKGARMYRELLENGIGKSNEELLEAIGAIEMAFRRGRIKVW